MSLPSSSTSMNTLELWPSLHKTALLGTARVGESLAAPPDAPAVVRAALDEDREGALLSLLAVCSLARRAGAAPRGLEDAKVLASTCAQEERAIAPAAACSRLRGLSGSSGSGEVLLLREWLEVARQKAVVAPHDALPGLLRLGSRSKALRAELLPVLGTRGRWLAAQNDDWAWARGEALGEEASADEAERAFRDGEGTARTEAFALLRSLDANRGLQVLADAWSRESANRRAQWIEMLQPDLRASDKEFLEGALDDRSDAVRKMAAQVLVALPNSAFARRAVERIRKYLRMEKSDGALHLEVSLPSAWDESWARDGIDEKGGRAPTGAATGQRMWWLVQMVAATPPLHWEEAWSATPSEVLEAVARDESALVEGLSLAAVRARDSRWLLALLSAPTVARAVAGSLPHHFLLSKVDPAQRDALLRARVRGVLDSLAQEEMDNVLGLLSGHIEPWSFELSIAVLDWMRALGRRAINEGKRSNASQWQFPGGYLLHRAEQFAALMHLDALATAEQDWPSDAPAFFETARAALREAYETRRALRREFES